MPASALDAALVLRYAVNLHRRNGERMDYQQALDYLYSFIGGQQGPQRPPPMLNLVRTRALLAALGNPQHAMPSVIVAGTKGKGSTAAFLEAMARAAGLRTGLWISPHLHTYRERIQVNRQLITRDELVRAVESIQPIVESMASGPIGAPVTFAIGFALALRYFAERNVDLAILEVGVGGRFDSAAVVTPILSVITPISYDHMDLLGDTLEQIAWEKAGVMKPGTPVISAPQHPEALGVLIRCAAEIGAPLYLVRDTATDRAVPAEPFQPGPWRIPAERYLEIEPQQRFRRDITPSLPGTFQVVNARLATGAALLLRDAGLPITDAAIAAGLTEVRWPGRLEIIDGTPPIVLDGAHNGESIHQLVVSLNRMFPGRRRIVVFGASRDKDLARMIPALAPAVDALVLTASRHPRALMALHELRQQFAPLVRSGTPIDIVIDPAEALARAHALAAPNDLICVTGSLFVVAAAREALGLAEEKD
ncbi:MAG: bifunctional folylpolyglutamate synthase/dihydrofolate synthase [Roseiflexus sp.]|nr:bifunctional folylpolyglutamate synthase/dihydrofolate synthase [Roseiflexus sp.]MCS7289037.1 bifunctional folylpolyglutamate synthase/dihydrofolate synthase [Roseiflexus sp.]MDW8232658.1 folylpolyglutamate synthase/dihydrofolate synthase family protein [Roseiflexaceae bacterium]